MYHALPSVYIFWYHRQCPPMNGSLYVPMYLCMYVSMYVCMHVCNVWMCMIDMYVVYAHVCMYVRFKPYFWGRCLHGLPKALLLLLYYGTYCRPGGSFSNCLGLVSSVCPRYPGPSSSAIQILETVSALDAWLSFIRLQLNPDSPVHLPW